ncbi:MAG TPA: FtsX-like permease family protein [Vicinamibacterales bacterium]|nr:FtsX-like permease family protein [Vicinamibacterales bacterium]
MTAVQAAASPQLEIVGVVSDVKQFTLDAPPTADLYVPLHQMPAFQAPLMAARMYWVVRGRGDVASLTPQIRSAVTQGDPGVAASSARTLESLWLASLGSRRASVRLLQVFGDVALVLCAMGVYAVAAFAARTRRRELAIRAALGASRRELTVAMLRRELRPVLLGLALGVVAAFVAAPFLFAGAFSISPRDGRTYLEAAGLLFVVAVAASYIPVRRAGATSAPADLLNH